MSFKASRAEQRRKERQRKQILNITLFGGASLLVAAIFILLSNRPVDDLVQPGARSFPVPTDGLTIGDPAAPVLVEVFEDFQCPSCLRFTEDFEPLILQNFVYNGVARLTFRNYPFIGNESLKAAHGALCANEQGRFWDYHDWLFANQLGENIGAFADKRLEAMAEQMGLDLPAWQECFNAERYEDAIQADLADGRDRGVTGTPTVFVNGVMLPSFDYATVGAAITAAAGQP